MKALLLPQGCDPLWWYLNLIATFAVRFQHGFPIWPIGTAKNQLTLMRLVTSVEEKWWSLQSFKTDDSSCCGCIPLLPDFLLSQDPFLLPGIASFTRHSPATYLWFFWSFKIQQLPCAGRLPPLNLLLHCVSFPFLVYCISHLILFRKQRSELSTLGTQAVFKWWIRCPEGGDR